VFVLGELYKGLKHTMKGCYSTNCSLAELMFLVLFLKRTKPLQRIAVPELMFSVRGFNIMYVEGGVLAPG
jgi:hypothetical protein